MSAVGTMSFAQSSQSKFEKATNLKEVNTQQNYSEKAPGVVLWDDTFDDPTNWTIDGDGAQGEWVIGGNNDVPEATGYIGDMASTTVADDFAFFDGVQHLVAGNVDSQNAWIEMTNSVDMTGYETVLFSFEQRYRAFNSDVTYLEISLDDGATWEQAIDINEEYAANSPVVQNTIFQEFNVNQSTQVKFRFRWENASTDNQAGSGYAWMVDDVSITSLPDNDMKTSNLYYGSNGYTYYQIPLDQTAPIDMSINVENTGINDQKGVHLSAEETVNGVFSDVSPSVDVDADLTDSLVLSSSFTPTSIGDYTMEFTLMNDSVDDAPMNNQISDYNFEVGQYIYARDRGTANGTISGSGFISNPILEPGNVFRIYSDADLTGVDVTFGTNQVDGIEVFGRVYGIDAQGEIESAPIAETDFYETSSDGGSNVTLVFQDPVSLVAGEEYVVSVGAFTSELIVGTSGESRLGTSVVYFDDDAQWYAQDETPMIRMNFDPTLSILNNEASNLKVSKNYPNPFSNETTVEYTLENASEVNYTLVDLTGKTILEVNEGNVMAGTHEITIDGANLANGVYYFNMTAGGTQTTHKMIVNK